MGGLQKMKLRRLLDCYFANAASSIVVAVMFVLLLNTTSIFAALESLLPVPMVWEQSFGDEQYSYKSEAAIVTSSGMLMAVGTYAPAKNRRAPPDGGWIWKIDGNGKRISDVRFDSSILGSTLAGIDALALVGDDNVAIVGHLSNGKSFLLHVNALGKVVKTIDLSSRHISKLFRMSDGSLMLAGQKNGDMLLMKLDKAGGIVWEKITDQGKDDALVDGSISVDRLLLVALSGKQEQFAMTDSTIGLVKPAIDGKLDDPIFTIKGRNGSLARDAKRIMLVYDAAMTSEQDIRFVMLDNALRVVKEAPITTGKISIERFKVGRAGEIGFIAAGTAGGKMILTFIDTDGQVKWQHTRLNDNAFFMNPEVVGNDSAYVISTMMVLTSEKQPKTLVNILKIDPSAPKQ